jgi:uncharacterized membrane protein YfhO
MKDKKGFYMNMKPKTTRFTTVLQLFFAPVVTAGILCIVFLLYGLFPFGEKTLSWGDMTQQVVPLLMQFRNILTGQDSLLYTFQAAGGMNFWGVFLFFLASPFSFLVLLVPKTEMILWINLLVVLKMMTCAFCAQIFFSRIFRRMGLAFQMLLSVSYAFCGYVMLYYQNLIWLDMMALFPLLMLSVCTLFRRGNVLPYIAAFTAMLIVNLYLSYMLVCYLILFFFFLLFRYVPKAQRGKTALLIGGGSIISVLLASPAWVPFLLEYTRSARGESLWENLTQCDFFSDFQTTLAVILPSVVCFAALVFVCRSYRKIQPVMKAMFLLLLVPMVIEPVNRIWHTGSYQAFPARYGYLAVFTGLILTAMVLSYRPKDPLQNRRLGVITISVHLTVYCGVMVGLVLWQQPALSHYVGSMWVDDAQFSELLLVFLLALIGTAALLFFYARRQLTRRFLLVSMSILILGGSLFQSVVYQGFAARDTENWLTAADLSDRIEDDSFYRVKNLEKYFDVNLVGGMGYATLNHYTSLTSQDYLFGMKKMGYSSYWMEVNSNGGTSLTDALLSNRYIIEQDFNLSEQEVVYRNDKYSIVKKPALSLGIISQNPLSAELSDKSRLDVQNQMFQEIFSSDEELMVTYEPDWMYGLTVSEGSGLYQIARTKPDGVGGIHFSIYVDGRQTLYFDCFDQLSTRLTEVINDSFSVAVNEHTVQKLYPDKKQNGLLCLGSFEDEWVTVYLSVWEDVQAKSFGVYGLREDLLEEELTQAQTADLTACGQTISGTVSAQEGESLFLSVPYDKGWQATVNGEPVEIKKVWDTFMEIPLAEGENEILLTYLPSGWNIGLMGLGIGVIFLLLFWKLKEKILQNIILQKAAVVLLAAVGVGAIFLLYLLPITLWIGSRIVL